MAKIKGYNLTRYEVKLKNKPIKSFDDDDVKALEYIDEHKADFVFMRLIAKANIEL